MSMFEQLEKLENECDDLSDMPIAKEAVDDGEYEMEIRKAELRETSQAKTPILEFKLHFLEGKFEGQHIELQRWAADRDALKRMLADVAMLGFEVHTWTPKFQKKISIELPLAVKRMPGIRLKVAKTHSTVKEGVNKGKVYHNFNFRSVVQGYDAKNRPELAPEPVPEDPFGGMDGTDLSELPTEQTGAAAGSGAAGGSPFDLPE